MNREIISKKKLFLLISNFMLFLSFYFRYFYGSEGIQSLDPGATLLGEPDQIVNLGKSEIPYSLFLEYLFSLGESSFG